MEDAGGFGGRILVGKGWGSLHVELKIIDNTSTQHPVFLDIPWAQKNMWLVTSYLSYRLNLYTTGVPNICWQQEYIYTRAGEDTGGFGDRILGEEGWWSMHFHFITHANSLKTTSVILPAKVKRISNPIFTSDLEIGFLASNGSSGHLLNWVLKFLNLSWWS